MAKFPQTADVDPTEVRSFDLIPGGWYNAELVDAEIKSAKSGNGDYLNLQFSLLDPPYVNRRVFVTLNLWNSNEQAVKIANQQRAELLHAVGKPNSDDTDEILGIPLALRLAIKEDKTGMYESRNEVKGFRSATGVATRATSATAARPAAPAAKPWQRAQ